MTNRVVAFVQARVQSSRLPAKIFLDLAGVPALRRCVDRVRRIEGIDEVVVATSTVAADDLVERMCAKMGVPCFRGDESDVLSRFLGAAAHHRADAIVRITSDCPLIDPYESGRVVRAFLDADAVDYASNVLERTLPRGLDTEIVSREALERAGAMATGVEREHVTLHVYRHPESFRLLSVTSERHAGAVRLTLDTLGDYQVLAWVYEEVGPDADVDAVLAWLKANPKRAALNADVIQKTI
jgi:spore coat polysaccharide biosynthesis protein SpsF